MRVPDYDDEDWNMTMLYLDGYAMLCGRKMEVIKCHRSGT